MLGTPRMLSSVPLTQKPETHKAMTSSLVF